MQEQGRLLGEIGEEGFWMLAASYRDYASRDIKYRGLLIVKVGKYHKVN